MAWKFLNIGKANREIDLLTAENSQLKAQIETLTQKLNAGPGAPPQVAEPGPGRPTENPIPTTRPQTDADELARENAVLAVQLSEARADLRKAQAQLADPVAQIRHAASMRAAEITAAQGQPPIRMAPINSPLESADAKSSAAGTGLARVQAEVREQIKRAG